MSDTKDCPICGMANFADAPRCQCGYDFVMAVEESPDSPTRVRMRGLVLFVAGILLTPVVFGLAYLLGLLLASLFGDRGPVKIAVGLVALPVVMAFIGWLEIVTGVSFRRLQRLFDKGGLVQLGVTFLVLASIGALIAGSIYMYNVAMARCWF